MFNKKGKLLQWLEKDIDTSEEFVQIIMRVMMKKIANECND